MKYVAWTISVALMLGAAGVSVAKDKAGDAPGKDCRAKMRERWSKRMEEMRAKRAEALGLSDQQQAKNKEIKAALDARLKELRTQGKALHEQMKTAREAKDEDKIKALREEFKKLMTAHKDAMEDARKQFAAVLTDEQKAKIKEHGMGRPHVGRMGRHRMGPGPFAALKLTDEQKKQAQAIMEAAQKKINDEVLTAEQREQFQKMRACVQGRRRGGLDKKPDSDAKPQE